MDAQTLRIDLQLLSNLASNIEARIANGAATKEDWETLPRIKDLKAEKIRALVRANETK